MGCAITRQPMIFSISLYLKTASAFCICCSGRKYKVRGRKRIYRLDVDEGEKSMLQLQLQLHRMEIAVGLLMIIRVWHPYNIASFCCAVFFRAKLLVRERKR